MVAPLVFRMSAALLALAPMGCAAVAAPQHSAPVAAPQALTQRLNQLGRGFNGRVGIAVQSCERGWRAGWQADGLYPQQSVSKFLVALTVMDRVDLGRSAQ